MPCCHFFPLLVINTNKTRIRDFLRFVRIYFYCLWSRVVPFQNEREAQNVLTFRAKELLLNSNKTIAKTVNASPFSRQKGDAQQELRFHERERESEETTQNETKCLINKNCYFGVCDELLKDYSLGYYTWNMPKNNTGANSIRKGGGRRLSLKSLARRKGRNWKITIASKDMNILMTLIGKLKEDLLSYQMR